MTEYALLIDGAFKEIRNYAEKPADIPHKNFMWLDVLREYGETAFEGIENDKWVIRTALPTFEQFKERKLEKLAELRWQKETSGTTFAGMPLATDAVSQTKYIGAVVGAQMDPQGTMKWKTGNGQFVTLDAAQIVNVAMAVRAHVQACFDREAELKTAIEATTTKEELDAIDINAGWPA
jgi:hypothetical protein